MALSKRRKTARQFARVGVPQRRHRAAAAFCGVNGSGWNMSIPTSGSAGFKKRRGPGEARLRLPWSVWADAHGFEFEFKDLSEFEPPLNAPRTAQMFNTFLLPLSVYQ